MNEGILIITIIGIVSLFALFLNFLTPKSKGEYGEFKVSKKLQQLSSDNYKVINDILIRNYSRSSQVDHVVISNYGIFVIETKNYKGWIFGHESSEYWTQTFYKKKHKFRNPVLQCWGHIKTLKKVLPEFYSIPYYPIVVFAGNAQLKEITSEAPVLYLNKLLRYISRNSTTEYLSDEEVDQVYHKLIRLNITDRISRKSHIKKAKTNQKKGLKSSTCPRCGGGILLKEGKYGMFYGCSTYPRCNFTKRYKE